MTDKIWTAALVIIGDEVLSGRTQDANTQYLAKWLNERGVRLREARVVPDVTQAIIGAVNSLRACHDYVFTTGGIGPTHDDITADAIAKAFDVPLLEHPEALRRLLTYYNKGDLTQKRRRMTRVPEGGSLIDNPLSLAPGFQVENVFTMAGIPRVMQAMLSTLGERVVGGAPMLSRDVSFRTFESELAGPLEDIQMDFQDISIGSYPFLLGGKPAVQIVARGIDPTRLEACMKAVTTLGDPIGDAGDD